jgi:hypothetical protein
LWVPIARSLSAAQLGTPATPLLLVGFVAIWLCLLLASGALHAWTSGWWLTELSSHEPMRARRVRESRRNAGDPGNSD